MKFVPVLALFVGVGAGLFLEGTMSSRELDPEPAPVEEVVEEAEVVPATYSGEPIDDEVSIDAESAPSALGAASKFFSARSFPRAEFVPAGRISGRVIDTNGNPLPGVSVNANSRRSRNSSTSESAEELDLETYLTNVVETRSRHLSNRVAEKTDADGRFSMEVADLTYRLSGSLDGYRIGFKSGVRAGDPDVELTATPTGKVSFRVLGPEGEVWPENVQIRFGPRRDNGRPPNRRVNWKPTSKPQTIDAGTFIALIDGDTATSEEVEVELAPGETKTVDLQLELAGELIVKLALPQNEVRQRFEICILRAEEGAPEPTDADLALSTKKNSPWIPDAERLASMTAQDRKRYFPPRATFSSIDPGRYRIGVRAGWNSPDFEVVGWAEVQPGVESTTELQIPPRPANRYMTVELVTPTGDVLGPKDQVRFNVNSKTGGQGASARFDDGRWRIELSENVVENVLQKNNEAGWRLIARAENYGSTSIDVVPGGHSTVRLETPVRLVVQLVGEFEDIVGEHLSVFQIGEGSNRDWKRISSQGVVEFDSLRPGTYRLQLWSQGRSFVNDTVEVAGPETRHTYEIPILNEIQFVENPADGDDAVSVRAYRLDDVAIESIRSGEPPETLSRQSFRMSKEGSIANLQDGVYRLLRSGPDGDTLMDVEVPTRGPIEWQGEQLEGYEIWTVNPDVLALGIENADVLLAVSGVEIRSSAQLTSVFTAAREAESVELEIRREGREQKLEVDLREIGSLQWAPNTRLIPFME